MRLEEYQAVSQIVTISNHINLSLMTVSLMKFTHWPGLPDKENITFPHAQHQSLFNKVP